MSIRALFSQYPGGSPPHASGRGRPPFNGKAALMSALALSLVLHIAGGAALLASGPVARTLRDLFVPREEEPIIVDVVELPPGAYSNSRLKKPARFYADRTQGVDKETFPEPSPVSPVRKAFPGLDAAARKTVVEPAAPEGAAKGEDGDFTVRTGGAGLPGKAGEAAKTAPPPITRPSLFPTGERLSELERRYAAEPQIGEKGKTLSLNTSELKYQKYLINMKNRIELKWEYPYAASRNGWQGNLQIDFTIKKDGTVADIKLVKSSNYPVLDDAAVTALRLASPFPPFPESFSVEEINIKGQFSYVIYEGQGR